MNTYRLSPKAGSDLAEIFDYTFGTWGERQAETYLEELASCFRRLADSPGLGRPCDLILPGIRRFEQNKHVVFYKQERKGIVITRVLHQRRLPTRSYLMETNMR